MKEQDSCKTLPSRKDSSRETIFVQAPGFMPAKETTDGRLFIVESHGWGFNACGRRWHDRQHPYILRVVLCNMLNKLCVKVRHRTHWFMTLLATFSTAH